MSTLEVFADTITRSICSIPIFNPLTDFIGGSSILRIAIINLPQKETTIYTTPIIPARKWLTTNQGLLDAGFVKVDEDSVSITIGKGEDGKFEDICRLVEELAKGGKKTVVKM